MPPKNLTFRQNGGDANVFVNVVAGTTAAASVSLCYMAIARRVTAHRLPVSLGGAGLATAAVFVAVKHALDRV